VSEKWIDSEGRRFERAGATARGVSLAPEVGGRARTYSKADQARLGLRPAYTADQKAQRYDAVQPVLRRVVVGVMPETAREWAAVLNCSPQAVNLRKNMRGCTYAEAGQWMAAKRGLTIVVDPDEYARQQHGAAAE
jgi:hypothetical protein